MDGSHLEVRQRPEGPAIRIVGDIDMSNADVIGERIDDAITNQSRIVEIDLGNVTYLDSAGLRVLSLLATRLHRLQIDLRVVAPEGSPARYVIDLTGLGDFVHVGDG
jgi:anti-anti-sigma factor